MVHFGMSYGMMSCGRSYTAYYGMSACTSYGISYGMSYVAGRTVPDSAVVNCLSTSSDTPPPHTW
eukprot:3941906-Rhodomonas_salina.1